jgi:competence ComEA-like helix-hairpin-helix protein
LTGIPFCNQNFVLQLDQLNVNAASEEELMTLPGITRNIAQNIVEYRQAIGRFKKVEDLALVSGIGADKLDIIRPEICVSRRKNVR